ncbi:kinesin-like protein KIF18A [Ornithodoros turicata]|uniref:kinesin-like protein KIF18A n=1 Tax=Ornithodoros turicata TaxID=34597 RepID=UPI00313A106A
MGPGMLMATPRTKRPSDGQSTVRSKRQRHSIGPDGNGHVTVAVRVRPLNHREHGVRRVVRAVDSQMLVFDPDEDVPSTPLRRHPQRQSKNLVFVFDKVFDEDATNRHVFENTTQPILDKLLEGCNCSVFAYGATGSGKTFTMLGSPDCHGVVLHTVSDLYERLEALKEERSFKVMVSYFEVYNENVKDLLKPGGAPLILLEDPVRGVQISKLSVHAPQNASQLLEMLHQGNLNRTQHPTDANAESSRSHAVFQVYLTQSEHVTGTSSGVRSSKMSFIDLAGSERAATVTSTGVRFREGTNINRSLLALGNCINALADYKRKGHVPYRDSKLTRILKDSLGGKCQTVMIAAISPSSFNYEDTYNTLKYADRAKNIRLEAKRNMVNVDLHVSMYGAVLEEYKKKNDELSVRLKTSQATVKELQEELSGLKRQLVQAPAPVSAPVPIPAPVPDTVLPDIERLYKIRSMLVKELCECDGSLRCMELKTRLRDMTLRNYSALTAVPSTNCEKPEVSTMCSEARKHQLTEKRKQLQQKLRDNFDSIAGQIGMAGAVHSQEAINREVRQCDLVLALEESQLRESTLMQACLLQTQQISQWDQMHQAVLPHIKNLHLLAEGHKYITNDLRAAYQNILSLAKSSGHVSWADQQDEEAARSQLKELLDIPRWHSLSTEPVNTADIEQPQTPAAERTTFAVRRVASPHPLRIGGAVHGEDGRTPVHDHHIGVPTPRQAAALTPLRLDQTFDAARTPQFQQTALRPFNRALDETFVAAAMPGSPVLNTLDATFMVNGTPKYSGMQRHVISHPVVVDKRPYFVAPSRGPVYRNVKENVPHQINRGRGGRPQQRGGVYHPRRQWRPIWRSGSTPNIGMSPFQQLGPRPCRPVGPHNYRGRGGYF